MKLTKTEQTILDSLHKHNGEQLVTRAFDKSYSCYRGGKKFSAIESLIAKGVLVEIRRPHNDAIYFKVA